MASTPVDDLAVFMPTAVLAAYEAAVAAAQTPAAADAVDASYLDLADGHWGTVKVAPV